MKVNLAKRLGEVKEYYFSQKLKEVAEMNKTGATVVNLGIGKPDLPPPALVIEKLREEALDPKVHGYQSYTGIEELRSAIATFYEENFEVKLNSSTEILPLIGSKEGIMHLSMALLDPGDEVLVPNPGYPSYTSATLLTGAKIIHYSLEEDGHYLPNIEELDSLVNEKTKLMWINYPHMPTGSIISKEKLSELVFWAKTHNIILVNDAPYQFILNREPISLLSIPGAKENCIELNSLSKSHNMSGWRVGMAVGNEHMIKAMLRFKSNMDSGMFRPVQVAAAVALSMPSKWYEANDRIYGQRRDAIWKICDELGFEYTKESAGLFVWSKVSEPFKNGEDASNYFLKKCRVFIPPGMIFGSKGEQYVRWSLCQNLDSIQEARNRIISVMKY